MKIRIRFRKYGVMKFIGHLDVMRYFQKAMRRAHIDICYSEGFSPHQIMSFAAPLGVGITSDGEYMDIEVHTSASTEESLRALNGVMVEGVECTGYVKLPDQAKTKQCRSLPPQIMICILRKGMRHRFLFRRLLTVSAISFRNRMRFSSPSRRKRASACWISKPLIYGFQVTDRGGVPVLLSGKLPQEVRII